MREITISTLFFIAFLMIASCKQDAKPAENPTEETPVANEQVTGKDMPSGSKNWDWAFLTNKIFEYRNGIIAGTDPTGSTKPFQGQWIDFEPDGTFEHGKYDKTDYTGVWEYEHDAQILTLFPDEKEQKNSQWRIKFADDVLIMIGTAKYGDNAIQAQLVRRDDKPVE